jgi:hypothetical protein
MCTRDNSEAMGTSFCIADGLVISISLAHSDGRGPPHLYPLTQRRLCRNLRKRLDVMLSKAKHLAFSSGYEVEILRLSPQNDIATQSQGGEEG